MSEYSLLLKHKKIFKKHLKGGGGEQSEPTISSQIHTYNLPASTTLYHGSKTMGFFDTYPLRLSCNLFTTFFTIDKDLATEAFGNCKSNPNQGFLHEFKTKVELTNIMFKPLHTLRNDGKNETAIDLEYINTYYCNNIVNEFGQSFNAVAFYSKKTGQNGGIKSGRYVLKGGDGEINTAPTLAPPTDAPLPTPSPPPSPPTSPPTPPPSVHNLLDYSRDYNIIIAICKPHEYLTYSSTQRCNFDTLGPSYSFAK